MRKILHTAILSLIIIFGISGESAHAQMTESLKSLCNDVIRAVHKEILSQKEDYVNLEDYGDNVLTRNQHGIYSIDYHHTITEGMRKGEYLSFGVTIVRMDDTNFSEHGAAAFNFQFPFLNIKFAGYQETSRKYMKFSVLEVVQNNGDRILKEQQKLLPLRITLEPDKESYKPGENVEITVTLENVSNKNLWVRELSKETLYFLYDDIEWGAVEVSPEKKKRRRKFILEPKQKMRKKFVGSGSLRPREIEVYCSYAMAFEGVRPAGVIEVKIVE